MTANSSAIVYVHGISAHERGYSDAWYTALKPHLSHPSDKHEVRWSDLVNALPTAIDDDPEAVARQLVEEKTLRDEIEAELDSRKINNRQASRTIADDSESMVCGKGGFDDFVRYMVSEDTRNGILTRFDEIVVPLLDEGQTLHIIAHSWGTVVSYEGLRRLDDASPPGRVANLFVLGSALSIRAVQRNLFRRVPDGRRPKLVDEFVNIDAGGDIVGGSIAPPFDDVEEFMQRKPTGCKTFLFRRLRGQPTAKNPFCAHRSYFHLDNVAVNRDIVADYINP